MGALGSWVEGEEGAGQRGGCQAAAWRPEAQQQGCGRRGERRQGSGGRVGVVVTVSGQGGPSLIVPATENAGGVERGQAVRGAGGWWLACAPVCLCACVHVCMHMHECTGTCACASALRICAQMCVHTCEQGWVLKMRSHRDLVFEAWGNHGAGQGSWEAQWGVWLEAGYRPWLGEGNGKVWARDGARGREGQLELGEKGGEACPWAHPQAGLGGADRVSGWGPQVGRGPSAALPSSSRKPQHVSPGSARPLERVLPWSREGSEALGRPVQGHTARCRLSQLSGGAADPTSTRRGGWAGEGQTWGQTDPCGSAGISQKPQTGYQRGPSPTGCTTITGMFPRLSNMWPLMWLRN